MPLNEFIINIYLMVDQYYNQVVYKPLRRCGYAPKLSDTEVICMELVSEFMSMDQEKQIWQYFKQHWLSWFPTLGSYPNFAKQCANLCIITQRIQERVAQTQVDNIHFIDGFPIPVCKYARAYRHKTFKVASNIQGLLGTDKSYIRPELKHYFASKGVDLQTPLRCNMKDNRPKSAINQLMNCRRNIETVIGQLSEQFKFNIQKVCTKDLWHLSHRFIRKILVHNFCFILNKQLGNPPL